MFDPLVANQSLPVAHVLMPVFNAEHFINNSIESVSKQNYTKIKLIIIDDGSTDGSMRVIEEYLKTHPEQSSFIDLSAAEVNQGVAYTRKKLLKRSKEINPNAYIFWLDADDTYVEDNFIESVINQMVTTKADICLINFSIIYEDERQIANAAGLIRDHENSKRIFTQIYNSPKQVVAPLDVDILNVTSLGCIKCYSPNVQLPEVVANSPFADFVYMAALLQVDLITTLDPNRQPMQYLRRSTSICGRRSPENFLVHVPTQLNHFINAVISGVKNDEYKTRKLQAAARFVNYKLEQYKLTLEHIVAQKTQKDINESTLTAYYRIAQEMQNNELFKQAY